MKLAYINSAKTLREVAESFGIKSAGVMRRAAKEGWEAERKQESAKVSKAAQVEMTKERTSRLARFNEQDIKIAEAIKAKAARMLNGEGLDDRMLANLTRVFDGAQKIGLLALGAATENHSVTTRELPPVSVDDFAPPTE